MSIRSRDDDEDYSALPSASPSSATTGTLNQLLIYSFMMWKQPFGPLYYCLYSNPRQGIFSLCPPSLLPARMGVKKTLVLDSNTRQDKGACWGEVQVAAAVLTSTLNLGLELVTAAAFTLLPPPCLLLMLHALLLTLSCISGWEPKLLVYGKEGWGWGLGV